ncbi:hypothetical protein BGZ83_000204 [Gryganskiella cystojenkinii]|nr:hypothetical protein BGZ83_000204 [Gryganskiella cystojenkinii]
MSHFTVLYFASAKDAAKTESERLDWSSGIDATKLTKFLIDRHPELEPVLKTCMFAVNMEYMDQDSVAWTVQPGDEVAVIPPVSGG